MERRREGEEMKKGRWGKGYEKWERRREGETLRVRNGERERARDEDRE